MARRAFLAASIAAAVLVLAVSAVSALSGGTAVVFDDDHPAVRSQEGARPVAHDNADADDPDDEAVLGDAGAGSEFIATAIAEEFGVSQDEVLALHDEVIGFGAIFKLYKLAAARGMSVQAFLDEIESEGAGFAFGWRVRQLTTEELEIFESFARNLGTLVSGARHKENGADENGEATAAGEGMGESQTQAAPPDQAPAHGLDAASPAHSQAGRTEGHPGQVRERVPPEHAPAHGLNWTQAAGAAQ